MAEMLGASSARSARYAYSIGFWAAVFASLLGVWQSVPYLYADFYSILKKMPAEARAGVTKVTSTPYRLALVFVTLAPIPFAFTGQPLQVIVTYTIVGSLFVPFLAATLLYLNNRVQWTAPVPHNNRHQRAAARDPLAVCDRRRGRGDTRGRAVTSTRPARR